MFAQLRCFEGAKPGKKPQAQLQAGSSNGQKRPNQDSPSCAKPKKQYKRSLEEQSKIGHDWLVFDYARVTMTCSVCVEFAKINQATRNQIWSISIHLLLAAQILGCLL